MYKRDNPEGSMTQRLIFARGAATCGTVLALCTWLSPASAWGASAFQESGGEVVIEAEHYDAIISRSGKDWVLQTSNEGYLGDGYLQALPQTGTRFDTDYATTSPEVRYLVSFTTPGTYYLWVRAYRTSRSDDGAHFGIDGTAPATADSYCCFKWNAWAWGQKSGDSEPVTLEVTSPGVHSVHLWMHEDGFRIDRLLLRTDSSSASPGGKYYVGPGPAESPRVSIGTDATPPVITSVAALNLTASSATITWSTDDPSTSQVEHGPSTSYGQSTPLDAMLVTSHSVALSGLSAGTVYHYRVRSKDAAGNEAVSGNATLTTAPPADATPPSGSVLINGGAVATNNPTATLTLSATDDSGTVAEMALSNDGVAFSPPEPYATSKSWTLSAGDGPKTVSVKFADSTGNWSVPASDAIQLDTTPPGIQITSPVNGEVLTAP